MTSDPPLPERGREILLVSRPSGEPVPTDFATVEVALPLPGPGQVLVRNSWLSVDPYMRGKMNAGPSYSPPYELGEVMSGRAVGEVVRSEDPDLPVGTTVRHLKGWREYALLEAGEARPVDVDRAPAEAYLGALGMPGVTAYAALTRVAQVEPGDVVFISAAAGAVGLAACRIARHRGAARIVGSAGGREKVDRLVAELGFDAAIDRRQGDIAAQLADAAPEGIDVYLDNVGGEHLQAAIASARPFGRVALCGSIAGYNRTDGGAAGLHDLSSAVGKRLTLRGFIASDHADLADEWEALAAGWLADGSLRSESTVSEGLDSAVAAFLGLFQGMNTGKMLVRL
ncbi:NADP-dependent oxidoreductase [Cnuibacter physcomitrellae]|uniref:NADP-dependent oxidoreductase n=1 Tax=Cnuibacter physcomitrellae TaxID=1619308 RepID=UPI002175BC28|nr:NADP-dependent oxidoreductase [Cnuibacter physcomitrellae]MCS5498266.1 NADP-dependent oxidoreductase [Cnuibacter physcomitrellae]